MVSLGKFRISNNPKQKKIDKAKAIKELRRKIKVAEGNIKEEKEDIRAYKLGIKQIQKI